MLVKLTLDFGDHKRTIIAGMKTEGADPKEIEGKEALFVVNLELRKMMGEVSEGMVFDIWYADGLTVRPKSHFPMARVRCSAQLRGPRKS